MFRIGANEFVNFVSAPDGNLLNMLRIDLINSLLTKMFTGYVATINNDVDYLSRPLI